MKELVSNVKFKNMNRSLSNEFNKGDRRPGIIRLQVFSEERAVEFFFSDILYIYYNFLRGIPAATGGHH